MLARISNILNIILILFILFSVGFVVYQQVNNMMPESMPDIGDIEESGDEKDDWIQPKYKYKEDVVGGLVEADHVLEPESMTYDILKKKIKNPIFIKKYVKAVEQCYKAKIKKYYKILKEDMEELEMVKDNSNMMDINKLAVRETRLRKEVQCLKIIINVVKQKLKDLTEKVVKRNLEQALHNPKSGIDSLIGRYEIKDFLAQQIFSFSNNPSIFINSMQNIIIMGKSGCGKTKTANVIAFVYNHSGILARGNFKKATKRDFTTAYVNESQNQTRELLIETLEGVLLIDEAYEFGRKRFGLGSDHGDEAMTELVNFLDKFEGLSIVIAAGYQKQMEKNFIASNEGNQRRYLHRFVIDDYTDKELTDILINHLNRKAPNLILDNSEANYIFNLIRNLNEELKDIFPNQAGSVAQLADCLSNKIFGHPTLSWSDVKQRQKLIRLGFNDYLRIRGSEKRLQ